MHTLKDKSLAIITSNKEEAERLTHILRSMGIEKLSLFMQGEAFLENDQEFDMILLRQELSPWTGLSLLQKKKRDDHPPQRGVLLLADTIADAMLPILEEFEVRHTLSKPFTQDRVAQKIESYFKLETEVNHFESELRQAKIAFHQGELNLAREICLNLFRSHGYQERILLTLGEIALRENKSVEARKFFHSALKVRPGYLPASHCVAKSHLKDRNFPEALALLEGLVGKNPLHLELLADTSHAQWELGLTQKARASCETLRRLDHKSRPALSLMAKMALAEGRALEACLLLKISHSDEELVQLLNNEGVRRSRSQDFEGAKALYQQCLEAMKQSEHLHTIYYNLGLACQKAEDLNQAQFYWQKALDCKPDYHKAQQSLDKIKAMTGAA